MIIIQVAGGLGNQLQQYAIYRKFISLGAMAKLDLSWFDEISQQSKSAKRAFELDYFDGLNYECCTQIDKARLYGTDGLFGKMRRRFLAFTVKIFNESVMYHPEIFGFTDMYLTGYFACEKYYADILPELRGLIRFKPSGNPLNVSIANEMGNRVSVAVHVRRGDYLAPENQELFGNICTDKYYEKAIDYISQCVPDAHFYLFSDDTDYVRAEYQGERFSYVDWNKGIDSIYDMFLMSQCKHIITANSTFSFWGARFNKNIGKIMIRPARHRNNLVAEPQELLPLWEGWTLIDNEGKVVLRE